MDINFLQLATVVVGTAMSLAYFPQAFRMYKNKSGFNVSIPTFLIFGLGTLLWTVYGFSIGDWVLIISFLPGVAGSWLILFLKIYYQRKDQALKVN